MVLEDSAWTGTGEYFENNYSPANPGPMPIGGTIIVGKHGPGNVIFQPGAGVTINSPDGLVLAKLHGKATLIKVGVNEWDLAGYIQIA